MTLFAALLGLALALPATAADQEQQTLPWDQTGKHVGETKTVEGRVLGVHCSPLSCLLAFEPTFNRFTAVVQARNFDTFPPADLERKFSGQRVRVRGKIVERDGKPEIVVEKAEDLVLVVSRREQREAAERGAKQAAEAQVELLERLANVLERVEEVTERMAAVQERMETLLVELEQRETALAALQTSQPPPPPPPSYGEAQPRPAFESLRTVKRGMSRSEVERLVGQPEYVESSGRGWQTWYYGYGRSVSFDSRGRAQSLVGFPTP